MKKNLRIVSAAAAALLAVAPVAAGVVPAASVSAATFVGQTNGNTFDAGSLDVPVENVNKASWKDESVQKSVNEAVAAEFGTKVELVNPKASEVTRENTQKVTFQVRNAGATKWAYGKAGKTNNGANMYWANTNGANKNMIVAANVAANASAAGIHTAVDAAHPVTFTLTLKYTKKAAPATTPTQATGSVSNNTVSFNDPATSSKGDVNFSSALQAVTFPRETTTNNVTGATRENVWDGQINGTVNASYKGQSYPVTFAKTSNVRLFEKSGNTYKAVNRESDGRLALEPAKAYYVLIPGASVNLGVANANLKDITLGSESGEVRFVKGNALSSTLKANTNQNGGVYVDGSNLGTQFGLFVKIVPTDVTNHTIVSFIERATNSVVNSGSLTMNATNQKLNVKDVLAQAKAKYTAAQETYNGNNRNNGNYTRSGATVTTTEADLTAQLEKAGIKVDGVGNFEAPQSFSFNLNAKSDANGATATLPVAVSVPNGKAPAASQETTKTITIMHISTVYDKNGVATHEPALRAYDTYQVASEPVTLKKADGKDAGKFYKLAGKDQYIKVGNVDGTSRTLKHNAYIYKSTGKAYMKSKKHHKVLKAGSTHTTYGKSFMIAGHQMYRIGRNQYVKKANF